MHLYNLAIYPRNYGLEFLQFFRSNGVHLSVFPEGLDENE